MKDGNGLPNVVEQELKGLNVNLKKMSSLNYEEKFVL